MIRETLAGIWPSTVSDYREVALAEHRAGRDRVGDRNDRGGAQQDQQCQREMGKGSRKGRVGEGDVQWWTNGRATHDFGELEVCRLSPIFWTTGLREPYGS